MRIRPDVDLALQAPVFGLLHISSVAYRDKIATIVVQVFSPLVNRLLGYRFLVMYRKLVILAFLVWSAIAQTTTADAPPPWTTGLVTEDGTCGKQTPNWVCSPSWGACCSKDGLCGRSSAFCGEGWYDP